MNFLIRDDDPCYYTEVEELEECYKHIYNEVPVCLSVTPFRIAGKYFPNAVDPDQEKPIHENSELVSYLKEGLRENRFDFALHGYSHIYHNDVSRKARVPEYASKENLHEKTTRAKSYLERLFEFKLTTFVPPSNRISKNGMQAVINNGLNLMHVPGFRLSQRPFNWTSPRNYLKTRLWMKRNEYPIYPFPIDFGDHQEMYSHLLYPKSELSKLQNQLNTVSKMGGTFVLATHYHAFDKRIKSGETIGYAFNKIIDQAKSMDEVNFITYRQLWQRVKNHK